MLTSEDMADHEPAVIHLSDYGGTPDSRKDTVIPMRQALEAASHINGPVVVNCSKGRYDFYVEHAARLPYYISNTTSEEENPDVTKTIGILIKGLNNVTIEGNGSLFVFHSKITMFVLDGCENVTIRNLNTDYEHPTVVEMKVEAVGNGYLDVRVHHDSHYDIQNGKLLWKGDDWRFSSGPMQAYDHMSNTTWRIDNLTDLASYVEELEPKWLRFHYGDGYIPFAAPGWILQSRDGIRDQVGAFVLRSRNTAWRNVGMHFMHGLGIVCQFSENISFDSMNVAPRPETGRTVTAFADCIHLSSCRGTIRVANSKFIGAHDDAINVHGTHLRVAEKAAPNQVLLRFMHAQSYGYDAFFPGDEIEFVHAGSLRAYAGAKVASAKLVNPREILVTLEGLAPEGIRDDDVVENVTWTPEVEIVNNYLARIPTRGVLVTTRKRVLIADNTFERMTMSAILVADDAENWYESGRVEDLMIRNNVFVECGQTGHPVIYIAPENTEVRSDHPVHQNMVIECNRFEMQDAAVLDAKSTRHLTFANNKITSSVKLLQSPMITDAISLTACSDVTIKDNFFDGKGLNRSIRLGLMAPSAVWVQPEQGLKIHHE